MKQSTLRSLAAVAALAPALACATSAPVTNASVTPAATTASAPAASAASQQSNVRTIGGVGAPIGLQLWSLRAMARTDPKAMLKYTRDAGITHVETAGLYGTAEQTAALLNEAGV